MSGNLTIIGMQHLFAKLIDMINANPIKARLYDANLNMVKEFTDISDLRVSVDEDYVYLFIRVIDDSNDEYSFKYMYVLGKDGVEVFHVVIHTFSQEYQKTRTQIVDIKVRTGITGCVSG